MDTRKYAIYSRKSKFTGSGESTKNQINLCINTLKMRISDIKDEDILIYEDEGYSGYNINRPKFKELLNDIKANKIKLLIFYKLDRISRNVKDFAKLMNIFDTYNLTFISATENIETVTPSGKAMTYMISVFAELERNTIAERIKDNMLNMAKSGVWLGGCTPTGYKSMPCIIPRSDGKKIKYYKLIQDDYIDNIKLIFNKYLDYKSLTKLETYLMNNNIYSKKGTYYTRFSLKNILTNPVYVIADKKILLYYKSLGAKVYENDSLINSKNGLMVYNKTKNINHKVIKKRNYEEWIVAIGEHPGIIKSETFLKINDILSSNKSLRLRKIIPSTALLSGLIKCPICNTSMRPKVRSNKRNGIIYDYICEKKEKSKGNLCNSKNINGTTLDEIIINHILNINIDTNTFIKYLNKLKNNLKVQKRSSLEQEIDKNERIIKDLIKKIKYLDINIIPKINQEILTLENINNKLKSELEKGRNDNKVSPEYIINNYKSYINKLDNKEKKYYIDLLIKKVCVKGSTIEITYV